ncbi:MAG: sugar ABC transporter permease [Lentisphaerae bacterium]|nr:sugar ABC transporter permease [Lentisphaerota bacterium]
MLSKKTWNLVAGIGFLTPNIIGFLAFTTVPLLFSMVLAFSNWDLTLHNMFQDEKIKFVGLSNFIRLFQERDFWKFLGNTLFFMMGAPLAIAGSLIAAILLNKDLKGKKSGIFRIILPGAILLISCVMLTLVGMGAAALTIVIVSAASLSLVSGILFGQTVYRTLFYLPHFTSGVAVYILWKKLYSPQTGPINAVLEKPVSVVGNLVNAMPTWMISAGEWLCLLLGLFIMMKVLKSLFNNWRDGYLGSCALMFSLFFAVLPAFFATLWAPSAAAKFAVPAIAMALLVFQLVAKLKARDFPCTAWHGVGTGFMISMISLVPMFVLIGFSAAIASLPVFSADGLQPPEWLASYDWAKPAIMIMGLWGAIGSNNMLLFLAGLSNVPPELEEAADIDGASPFQKFWHVIWPQLAPITFFIVVMSVIGGLQGGFEMARTMTQGGPWGSTTTLSYFIYNEGFATGRLGYSSAISWVLFIMVFSITMINWKFGSKYVND